MSFGLVLNVIFAAMLLLLFSSASSALNELLWLNAGIQFLLFSTVACIPFMRTGRMSYVDIAWPFGVALIGAQILFLGEADGARRITVGGIYLFIGLRMGFGALVLGKKTGVIFKSEFPRYQYSRLKLEEKGIKHPSFHMLCEIIAQGMANVTVLALPGFIIATYGNGPISSFEILGLAIWFLAYTLESIADGQKLLFISKNKDAVCNVGLWRYSRHPNYFSEWLVWTGLAISTISAWWIAFHNEVLTTSIVLGLGTVGTPAIMYITLVYLTGAKPAEYYSAKKRAGYIEYQRTTSMFFPWFPKKGA
jgi:steroid 5-alpha reductase family enzyme